MSAIWACWADIWNLYHKVTFDGENRLIIVNPNETTISVKRDIYSSWKEWVKQYDHAKFLPALRTIGGDSVGGGLYAGDIYFLINNWQVVISDRTNVSGVLYHDNPLDPYIVSDGGGVISTVSNLVQTSAPNVIIDGGTIPTATEVAQAVWNYTLRELTTTMTPEEFWNFLLTTPMAPGSAGEKLKQALTTGNFLALK
jgi:hypothetical protein